MILNYTEPQLNIDQKLAVEITSADTRQAAVIIGTQYASPGFTEDYVTKTFNSEGDVFDLSFTQEGEVIEVDSAGLFYKLDPDSLDVIVSGAEYDLVSPNDYDEDNGIDASRGTKPNIVVTNRNLRVAGNGVLWNDLYGRPVSVGDTVYCYTSNSGGTPVKRKVTGFVGRPISATVGTNEDKDDTLFSAASANPVAYFAANQTGAWPYAPENVEFPSNYTAATGNLVGYQSRPTAWATGTNSPNSVVNRLGHSFLNGNTTYAGLNLSISVISYNSSTASGTAKITSTNGLINTVVPFTFDGELAVFNLSSIVAYTGFAQFEATVVDGQTPQAGDTISFRYHVSYSPLSPGGDITSGSSSFTGTTNNTFYVRVIQGSYQEGDTAVVQIYDGRGSFTPFTRNIPYGTTSITIPISSGVEVVFDYADIKNLPQRGLRKNDTYFIEAIAQRNSTTEFNALVLDGPAALTGNVSNIKIRGVANGSLKENQPAGNGFALEPNGTSVRYDSNILWKVDGRESGSEYLPLVDGVGTIFADWRAAKIPQANENKIAIRTLNDIAQFGPLTPDNDLAFAVYTAWKAEKSQTIFALRTGGDDQESIELALKKIESADNAYALAVISNDVAAFSTAVDHAEAMSSKTVKNFRRVYFGVDVPAEFSARTSDLSGIPLQATITDFEGENRLVTFSGNPGLTETEVFAGDIVRVFGTDFVVQQIISDNELIITTSSAPQLEIFPAVSASIIKKNTPQNQVTYVSEIAQSVRNRRGVLIWSDSPVGTKVDGTLFTLPNKFIAAEIAARRAALLPQLGLTKTELTSVIETPAMYSRYDRTLLNTAAANGVLIVAQDNEGAKVVVRHQLTTDSNNGILYYEDSVGVNVDNLSLQIKDVLEKYIGRKNVTPTTLGLLRHDVFTILENARTTTIALLDVGPQILNFYDENKVPGKVTVKNHPTFRDRVLVKVTVAIPLPMNVIEVEIEAISEVVVAA